MLSTPASLEKIEFSEGTGGWTAPDSERHVRSAADERAYDMLGRLSQPNEIITAALYLASSASSFTTGWWSSTSPTGRFRAQFCKIEILSIRHHPARERVRVTHLPFRGQKNGSPA